MDFRANFTAIDFETASRRADSACQLAAVRVRDGQIVDQAMWMIRPEPFFFARTNIGIHGITPQQVESEASFGELWNEIAGQFGDDCLVAHNASFDIGVLLACLTKHRKAIPELEYTCTRSIARHTWPGRHRYGLKPLSDWLGVRFQHHDALEDSIACAKILLAAGVARKAESLPDLEKKLRLSRGAAGEWGKKGPSRVKTKRRRTTTVGVSRRYASAVNEQRGDYQTNSFDLQRLLIRADFIRPLAGKQVVFTGKLKMLSLEEAELLTSRSGGDFKDDVTEQTSFVVVGAESAGVVDATAPNEEVQTTDHCVSDHRVTAQRLLSGGSPIRIVSENEFLELLATVPLE